MEAVPILDFDALTDEDDRFLQWVVEGGGGGSPAIGVGSRQGHSPTSPPPASPGPRTPTASPGRLTPASRRSWPSWAGTPPARATPSPQYSPTRSHERRGRRPLNQDELRRQIDLLTQDQQQRYQNRSIQAVTHTNTITTVYKDGRPPSVRRTSSRLSTPMGTPPTPVRP